MSKQRMPLFSHSPEAREFVGVDQPAGSKSKPRFDPRFAINPSSISRERFTRQWQCAVAACLMACLLQDAAAAGPANERTLSSEATKSLYAGAHELLDAAADYAPDTPPTSRIELYAKLGSAYALCGDKAASQSAFGQAKRAASELPGLGLPNTELAIQVCNYSAIAHAQLLAGDANAAKDSITEAEKSASQLRGTFAVGGPELAHVLAEIGDLPAAMAMAKRCTEVPDLRWEVYEDYVESLLLRGDIDGAKAAGVKIDDENWRSIGWMSISQEQARKGQYADAEASLQHISGESSRATARQNVRLLRVESLVRAGDVASAAAIADEVSDAAIKEPLLARIAALSAATWDVPKTQKAIQRLTREDAKAEVRQALAEALASRGDGEGAMAITDQIMDPYEKRVAYVGIAEAYLTANNTSAAIKTLQKLTNDKTELCDLYIQSAQGSLHK